MALVAPDKLMWAILNNFSKIDKRGFYNLAFIIEHEYFEEYGERITETEYREMLKGLYNEELETTLEESHRLEFETVKLAGDERSLIIVPVTQVQSLPETVESTVEQVIEEFSQESAKIVTNNAKARIPRKVNLTSVIDFDELYEDALPFLKRIHRE